MCVCAEGSLAPDPRGSRPGAFSLRCGKPAFSPSPPLRPRRGSESDEAPIAGSPRREESATDWFVVCVCAHEHEKNKKRKKKKEKRKTPNQTFLPSPILACVSHRRHHHHHHHRHRHAAAATAAEPNQPGDINKSVYDTFRCSQQ